MRTDESWLSEAVELAFQCPPSDTAFSVGAIIVSHGVALASGYSRETDPHVHAEEAALAKVAVPLASATMYTSLEPCTVRRSRPRSCTQLILASGISRVVFAWREPTLFVDCDGAETLAAAGVSVVELPSLAEQVRAANAHLFSS